MNGTEIIAFLANHAPMIQSAVSAVSGALLTAIFLRHNTAAAEFEKIKTGQFKEVADDLLATGKMTYTEYYKANNFLNVAKKADEEYSKTPHIEKVDTYNFDWFIRFYEAVGNISNEEMQKIWAKILAGEINHPSSYSLRTIDILKNLSQEDALQFKRICSFCIHDRDKVFVPFYKDFMKQFGISYSEMMALDELGIMVCDGMLVLKVPVSQKPRICFLNRGLILTIASVEASIDTMDIQQFPLTSVGKELATLIGDMPTDEVFLAFAKNIKNSEYNVCVYEMISINEDGTIIFNPQNLLDS